MKEPDDVHRLEVIRGEDCCRHPAIRKKSFEFLVTALAPLLFTLAEERPGFPWDPVLMQRFVEPFASVLFGVIEIGRNKQDRAMAKRKKKISGGKASGMVVEIDCRYIISVDFPVNEDNGKVVLRVEIDEVRLVSVAPDA